MNNKGFTLIELMVVIVIIGIVTGIAIPTLTRNLPYRRLMDGCSQIKGDLMLMRQRSLVESSSFGMAVLGGTHQYTLFEDLNNNGTYEAGTDRVVAVRELPPRVDFSAPNQTWTFLRSGVVNTASLVNLGIQLQNYKNEQLSLTLMLSGMVVD